MNKKKTISFGDKIFARVTRNGQTIYNFVSEQVANMTDLVNQLRIAMRNIQGLVMIHIRNYNQGWGDERPLMLYAPKQPRFNSGITSNPIISIPTPKEIHFPWETH